VFLETGICFTQGSAGRIPEVVTSLLHASLLPPPPWPPPPPIWRISHFLLTTDANVGEGDFWPKLDCRLFSQRRDLKVY